MTSLSTNQQQARDAEIVKLKARIAEMEGNHEWFKQTRTPEHHSKAVAKLEAQLKEVQTSHSPMHYYMGFYTDYTPQNSHARFDSKSFNREFSFTESNSIFHYIKQKPPWRDGLGAGLLNGRSAVGDPVGSLLCTINVNSEDFINKLTQQPEYGITTKLGILKGVIIAQPIICTIPSHGEYRGIWEIIGIYWRSLSGQVAKNRQSLV